LKKKKLTKKDVVRRKLNTNGLTKRQLEFVRCYRECNGDIEKTATAMNVTSTVIYRWLQCTNVKNEIANSLDYCRNMLVSMSPNIVQELRGMMLDKDVSASVRANIGLNLLDRAGITTPKEPLVSVNINTVISDRAREILAKRLESPTIEVESL
jgi:hypothetical protein